MVISELMKKLMAKITIKNYVGLAALFCCGTVLFSCVGCKKTQSAGSEKIKFEVDKVYERGPLTVHVRLDKTKLTIAETIQLELEAAVGRGYEVQMPKVDKVLENFGIVDWHNPADRLDENNKVVSTTRYRLEPFLSGKYQLPAFTFEFRDANSSDNKKYELATEPVDVEVTSLLGKQPNLTIADIEGVVDMPRQIPYLLSGITGLLIIIIVAAGYWLYLCKKRSRELVRIFKPAYEIAYERLRALIKDDLIAAGRIKEFYERISDILRHYIEHRFDLRAPERTTEEFLNELRFTSVLSASDKKSLEEFLMHCDLVKFAKYSPTAEQIQKTFDSAKDFIEKTKSEERKIDVTDVAVKAGST